jgi:hypothetical protein
MDIEIGRTVRIGDISYHVIEIHPSRSNYYRVQEEGKEPIWVSGDRFTYTFDEMVRMGHFRNRITSLGGSAMSHAGSVATSSEIQAAFNTPRQELRTRESGGIVRK